MLKEVDYEKHFEMLTAKQIEILEILCEYYGVKKEWVFLKSRKYELAMVRHLFRYYLRCIQLEYISETNVGILTSYTRCDHTTVIHSIDTIRALLESNHENLREIIKTIRKNPKSAEVVLSQIKKSINKTAFAEI